MPTAVLPGVDRSAPEPPASRTQAIGQASSGYATPTIEATPGVGVTLGGNYTPATAAGATKATTVSGNSGSVSVALATGISREQFKAQVEAEAKSKIGKSWYEVEGAFGKRSQVYGRDPQAIANFVAAKLDAYDGARVNITTGIKKEDLDNIYQQTLAAAKKDVGSTSSDALAALKDKITNLGSGLLGKPAQAVESPNWSVGTASSGGSSWTWLLLGGAALVAFYLWRKR